MPHNDDFATGCQLFNDGHFWHAHEAWESCWLAAAEPERTLYQGLIQAAAALVKWQAGNRRGLLRNWAKARPKLVAASLDLGLDLGSLITAIDELAAGQRATAPQLERR